MELSTSDLILCANLLMENARSLRKMANTDDPNHILNIRAQDRINLIMKMKVEIDERDRLSEYLTKG